MTDPLRVLDLFSGIGGFSLGLERTGGFRTVAFCEIDPFARRVLAKHWPEVPCYDDVRSLNAERLAADGIAVDVICGGFPCQDISVAGKGEGLAGGRSRLWSEIARLSRELRPALVIVENVAALLGRGLGAVLGDLAEIGFDAEWHCIPAAAIGAPHIRDRFWLVAYPCRDRRGDWPRQSIGQPECHSPADASGDGTAGSVAHASDDGARRRQQQPEGGEGARHVAGPRSSRLEGCGASFRIAPELATTRGAGWWEAEPDVGRVAHGVPSRVDRLRCLGNAVVPQIPELIGRAILTKEAAERR